MKKNFTLLEFMRDYKLSDSLLFKDAAIHQMIFVRDTIGRLVKSPIFVVSTHTSKSCLLPVYGFMMPNGMKVIMRENFYGWVVSMWVDDNMNVFTIDSNIAYGETTYTEKDGKTTYTGRDGDIHSVYCEGFDEEWVYPYNPVCTKKVTFRVESNYDLYTLLYNQLKYFYTWQIKVDGNTEFTVDEIKNIYNFLKEDHPSVDKFYELFPETYNKATNYDFSVANNLSTYPDMEDLFNRIVNFEEIKKCFAFEYYRFFTFEKFKGTRRIEKLEDIRGSFKKKNK